MANNNDKHWLVDDIDLITPPPDAVTLYPVVMKLVSGVYLNLWFKTREAQAAFIEQGGLTK